MVAWVLGLAAWRLGMVVTLLFAAGILVGWGLLLQRLCRLVDSKETGALLRSFWLGLGAVVAFLQFWHLLAPVGELSLCALACAALCGWLSAGPDTIRHLWRAARGHSRLTLGYGLVLLFLAHQACADPFWPDTGLYHLQAIRWNQAFAIVPGLGNLHYRLAFNNSIFLLHAQALLGPWHETGWGIVDGLLLAGLAAQVLLSCHRLIRRASDAPLADAFGAALLIPLLAYQHFPTQTTSTDVTVALLQFAVLPYLVRVLAASAERPPRGLWASLLLSAGLLAVTIATKLSALPFAMLASALLTTKLARAHEWGRQRWTYLGVGTLFGGALVLTWAARGVVLSGYPAFPSAFLPFNVPWRVGPLQARMEQAYIFDYAWTHNREVAGWPAAVLWWYRSGWVLGFPLGWSVMVGLWVMCRWNSAAFSRDDSHALLAIGTVAAGAVPLWFITAPDPRFGVQYIFILGVSLLAAALHTLSWPRPEVAWRGFLTVMGSSTALAVACYSMIFIMGTYYDALDSFPMDSGSRIVFKAAPLNDTCFHMPLVAGHKLATDSGLEIWVPTGQRVVRLRDTKRGGTWKFVFPNVHTWDAPLPATYTFNARLRLRREGELGSGFVLSTANTR